MADDALARLADEFEELPVGVAIDQVRIDIDGPQRDAVDHGAQLVDLRLLLGDGEFELAPEAEPGRRHVGQDRRPALPRLGDRAGERHRRRHELPPDQQGEDDEGGHHPDEEQQMLDHMLARLGGQLGAAIGRPGDAGDEEQERQSAQDEQAGESTGEVLPAIGGARRGLGGLGHAVSAADRASGTLRVGRVVPA